MRRSFVLFDFDGVIADSYWLAFETAHTLHPHFTEESHLVRFEGNIYDVEARNTEECDANCRQGFEAFWELYSPRIGDIQTVAGAKEFVATLAQEHTLVVVSSSPRIDIMAMLKRFGMEAYFADVFGMETHMSKVEKIKIIFGRYETTPADCVFITDTLGDMREAAEVGVQAIGVTWGFHSRETLAKGDFFRIVEKPEDLSQAVGDFFENMYASA